MFAIASNAAGASYADHYEPWSPWTQYWLVLGARLAIRVLLPRACCGGSRWRACFRLPAPLRPARAVFNSSYMGYSFVASVLERAGQRFKDVVRERVLVPAGIPRRERRARSVAGARTPATGSMGHRPTAAPYGPIDYLDGWPPLLPANFRFVFEPGAPHACYVVTAVGVGERRGD